MYFEVLTFQTWSNAAVKQCQQTENLLEAKWINGKLKKTLQPPVSSIRHHIVLPPVPAPRYPSLTCWSVDKLVMVRGKWESLWTVTLLIQLKTMNSGAWWKREAINMNHFSRCSACKWRAVDGVNCTVKKTSAQFARPQFLSSADQINGVFDSGRVQKTTFSLVLLLWENVWLKKSLYMTFYELI